MMRVAYDEIDDDEDLCVTYAGQLYTGEVVQPGPYGLDLAVKEFKDGVPHGSSREYYDDGIAKSEEYFDMGTPQGVHRYWYPNGVLRREQHYSAAGLLLVDRKWSADGALLSETTHG